MLLRRFTKHITDQNWFAVSLYVIVVIVGIFLGLQVQNWYEAQADRELEKVYLQRLLDDADASIAALGHNITLGETRIEAIDRAYQLMFNHQITEDNREEFSNYFNDHKGFSIMDVYLTTIDELVASGQVTLIQSNEIREATGLLRKEYDVADRSQQREAAALVRLFVDINELIKLDEMGKVILNPLADLNGDGIILRKFRMILGLQRQFHVYNIRIYNYTKEYWEKVSEELDKH